MIKPCYINAVSSISPNGEISGNSWLNAIEPDYKDIIQNANLRRRMSRIIKMGVAAGLTCLSENGTKSVDSIITATGLGCLADTEKFLNSIIENDEELLNPTAFIQSTFNTIGSQIALLIGCHAYNNTFVHRGLSFETALIDSMMRICEGNQEVLVGAIDEVIPTSHTIMQRLGLLEYTMAGEGANFFLLSEEATQNTYTKLCAVETRTGKIEPRDLTNRIKGFLKRNNLQKEDINIILSGRNGNPEQDKIYEFVESELFSSAEKIQFKNECGEYFTATSYAMGKAANLLKGNRDKKQHLLIYNHFNEINHALILLASQ